MVNLETEKAFNDIRSTLIRRGVSRCSWAQVYTNVHNADIEIQWVIYNKALYRHSWRIKPYTNSQIIEAVEYWIENEVGIPLETETEKVSRIIDTYDT